MAIQCLRNLRRQCSPRILPLLVLLATGLAQPALADKIHLTGNRTIVGVIDEGASDPDRVAIRTTSGVLQVPRVKITRIEREKMSRDEANGDLAASEGNLELALELYLKAQADDPRNERLAGKIKEINKKIQVREQQIYANSLAKVKQILKEQRFAEAIDEAKYIIERTKSPQINEQCHVILSQAYIGLAQRNRTFVAYPEAELNYEEAIKADPGNPISLLELAELIQQSPERKAKAIELFQSGIDAAQKRPGLISTDRLLEYRYNLAQLLNNTRQYAQAVDTYLAVTSADKNMRFPQAVKFAIEANTKATYKPEELDHVITNLKTIIALNPPQVEQAYRMLGRIYYDRKDWADARVNLEAALKGVGKGAFTLEMQETLYYLGICYRRLMLRDQAAEIFQRLLAKQSSNYDAICELADIRREQADYDQAKILYDQALAVNRDKHRAYLGKGLTLQRQQQFREARNNFKEVITRDNGNVQAQIAIAQTYFDEKNWDDATTEAKKLLDMIETRYKDKKGEANAEEKSLMAQALGLMGETSMRTNKTNMAREHFRNSLKYQPDYAPAMAGMANAYLADKQFDEAEQFLIKASVAAPQNADYQLNLAVFYHVQRKNPEKALPYYYKYYQLGGKDPKVKEWITECGGIPPKV